MAASKLDQVSAAPPDRDTAAFTLLAAVQFVLILAMTVLNVALPDIQRELSLGTAELALLGASYPMTFSGLLLLGGRLTDLYGARRVFVTGTGAFAIASAAAGLAPTYEVLLGARFLQGIGAALAVPAAMALVSAVYPDPARHARAMAVWGGLAAFGGTAGMLLSGVVAWWDSWRWALVLPLAVAVVAVLLTPRLLTVPARDTTGQRLDVLGAALVTLGITLLGYGLLEAPEHGWTSTPALTGLISGAVLLVLFVLVERRVTDPVLPLSFLCSPVRLVALVAVFLGAAGITTLFFLLPLYFQQVLGYSSLRASAAFLPFGAVLVVTGLVVGRLVQRFGPKAVAVTGLLVAGVALALLAPLDATTPYVGPVLAALLLFPAGAVLIFAGSTVSATTDVPPGQAGLAGAVVTTALEMGPAVGLSVLVTVAAARTEGLVGGGPVDQAAIVTGYGTAFAVAAAALGLAAVGALVALRTPRQGDR